MLIVKALQEELTNEEKALFDEWLLNKENKDFFDRFTNKDVLLEKLVKHHRNELNMPLAKKELFDRLGSQGKLFHIKQINWLRYVAAASVFFLLAISAYFWFRGDRTTDKLVKVEEKSVQPKDIPPGRDGAILTLANGQQIVLDSAANGELAMQGNTQVKKNGAVLAYNDAGATGHEIVYNTLTTPRARQFQLELQDGTKIWLNAASSVTYPNAFAGKERRIEITGEAYLEVAKDASRPFIITVSGPVIATRSEAEGKQAGATEIEVLGTSFNINSYPEENNIKTTLIEGSVKVRKGTNEITIKPGQQAQVIQNTISVINDADIDATIAWKNGLIVFNRTEITVLLRQISRWYDVEFEIQGKLNVPQFMGEIPRTLALSQVLKAIEETANIKMSLEEKIVIVSN